MWLSYIYYIYIIIIILIYINIIKYIVYKYKYYYINIILSKESLSRLCLSAALAAQILYIAQVCTKK